MFEAKDWERVASTAEFQTLMRRKRRFVIPATIFFIVYYFALPVAVGYAPDWMSKRVGRVNIAYLFALSQFVMAWVLAWLYVRAAGETDRLAEGLRRRFAEKGPAS